MKKGIHYGFILLFILGGMALGVLMNRAPKVPSVVSLMEFSVERAMAHIQNIAQIPHPVGVPEHERVKNYILNQLKTLGLQPEIQETVSLYTGGLDALVTIRATRVENILARIKGTANSRAVLLMTHYDTVPYGPGANDDSAGVATILEILRAFQLGRPLKNDLIILITDAEETGLMGAKAFVEEHPWAVDVGVVINLEARGGSGTSYMFETGPDNEWLIKAFAKSAKHPIGNSMTNAIYQQLPNATDFTHFKDRGIAGCNFAFIDDWYVYHTHLDDLDHLQQNTLYHQGASAFEITRTLANMSLDSPPPGDAVYFNLWRTWMLSYPEKLIWPFAAGVALLFLATVLLLIWRGYITLKGLLIGAVSQLGLAVLTWGVATIVLTVIRSHFGDRFAVLMRYPDYRNIFLLGLVMLIFTLFFILYGILQRWVNISSLSAGAMLWWLLGLVLICIFLPHGSYWITWPLLFGLIGLWCIFKYKDPDRVPPEIIIPLGFLNIAALSILSSLFFGIKIAFSLDAMIMILAALFTGLLVSSLIFFRPKAFWGFGAIALLLGVGIIVFGFYHLDPQNRPQQQMTICHVDANQNQAVLALRPPNSWTAQWLGTSPTPRSWPNLLPLIDNQEEYILPPQNMQPSSARVIQRRQDIGRSFMEIGIKSERPVAYIDILATSNKPILAVDIEGKSIPATESSTNTFFIRAYGFYPREFSLNFTLEADSSLEIQLVDASYDLPPGVEAPQAPNHIFYCPLTLVSKTIQIPKE